MEVKYNIKNKFKNNKYMSSEEFKDVFNRKLLNIILLLERQNNVSLNNRKNVV